MRRGLAAVAAAAMALPCLAQPAPGTKAETNPFFTEWTTPFGMAPFDRIRPEHYLPAFEAGIAERRKEVEAIAKSSEPPTFANTVEALENGGLALARVSDVFYTLSGADTNDQLQAITKQVAPLLSALRDDIRLNDALFARVKAVWEKRETLEPHPRAEEARRGHLQGLRAWRCEPLARAEEAVPRDQPGALAPRHPLRRQPPQGDERLPARRREEGRPRRAPAGRRGGRGRRGEGREARGQVGLHAPGAFDLALPDVRREPRAPEGDPDGLREPVRQGGRHRQQGPPLEDGGPPGRAGEAPRLRDLGRLRPRREHGQDARRASTTSSTGSGSRPSRWRRPTRRTSARR